MSHAFVVVEEPSDQAAAVLGIADRTDCDHIFDFQGYVTLSMS